MVTGAVLGLIVGGTLVWTMAGDDTDELAALFVAAVALVVGVPLGGITGTVVAWRMRRSV